MVECEFCEWTGTDLSKHYPHCKKRKELDFNNKSQCVKCSKKAYVNNESELCLSCEMEKLDDIDLDELTLDDNNEIITDDITLDDTSSNSNDVCSFRINVDILKNMLNILTCRGYMADSSSPSNLVNDCIFRFDNDKIWSIVEDNGRYVICYVKADVKYLTNPTPIPIEISELSKWLQSFSSGTTIEIIYENGIVGLRDMGTKNANFIMKTSVVFATKRKEVISNDIITNLEFGNENDKIVLNNITNMGHSVYTMKNKTFTIFFGKDLPYNFNIPTEQMKKIIDDGERTENRVYPFNFHKNSMEISIKNTDDNSNQSQITRDIKPKIYNVSEDFNLEFSARLTNAINNVYGELKCFVSIDGPMSILSKDKTGKIDICYIITTL